MSKKRRHGKKRRRRNYTLYYILLAFIAVCVGLVLSLTVFFKIETVRASYMEHYDSEEVAEESGIKIGENLFMIDSSKVEKRLLEKYVYISKIKLRRLPPSTVYIEITEEKPRLLLEYDNGAYMLISETGKVLENTVTQTDDLFPVVVGVTDNRLECGETVEGDCAEGLMLAENIIDAADKAQFTGSVVIDVSDPINIIMKYDDNVEICLGSESRIDEKMKMAAQVLALPENRNLIGVLDVSTGNKATVKPQDIRPVIVMEEEEEETQEQNPAVQETHTQQAQEEEGGEASNEQGQDEDQEEQTPLKPYESGTGDDED